MCPAIQSGDAAQLGIEAARFEFGATCFTAIQELLDKTGTTPKQIDYVITNSSLFNPTPSLSAAIMNHFKMRSTTVNYSLGGMGCRWEQHSTAQQHSTVRYSTVQCISAQQHDAGYTTSVPV